MKVVRSVVTIVLMSAASLVFAQSSAHNHEADPQPAPPSSEAQKSFAMIKTLAGEWEGRVKADLPIAASMDVKPLHVTMRVTSRGNVVVHEFQEADTPLDPAKYDHPVTMLYVDADKLNLVHYCDAGNRPHMTGKMSPDGKTVEFEFADVSGSTKFGHMHHAVFTAVDENHHTEDWTFELGSGQVVHAHFDLHRVN